MKRLFSIVKRTNWYFWLAALALHGALLALPMHLTSTPPKEKPMRVARLVERAPGRVVIPRKPVAKVPAKPKVKPSTRQIARPNPVVLPTPAPKPSPVVARPTPKPSPTPATDPLALFAKDQGAEPGCGDAKKEDCWQLEDTQWRSVAGSLEQRLQGQGYVVTKLDDLEDETGMGIFKVDKNGVTKYLHLLLTDRGTVYLLETKPLSRNELEVAVGV